MPAAVPTRDRRGTAGRPRHRPSHGGAVAAQHPETARVGGEVLAAGGSAADAAVAMALTACAAETTLTGLAGGAHAVLADPSSGVVCLDGFVAAPGLGRDDVDPTGRVLPEGVRHELVVPFGAATDTYVVGPGTVGVPGVPALLAEVHRRAGRLPWVEVVRPAAEVARRGAMLLPSGLRVLDLIGAVLETGPAERTYVDGDGRRVAAGTVVRLPGLVDALDVLAERAGDTFRTGPLAEALLAASRERGGLVTPTDLERYRVEVDEAATARLGGATVHVRAAHHSLPAALAALPDLAPLGAGPRAVALATALRDRHPLPLGTTNVSASAADGTACAITTSLGIGAGEWLEGYDVHLSSMLGEPGLADPPLPPGARVRSDMSPLVVTDRDGVLPAAGATGASRIRTALVHSLVSSVVDAGDAATAVRAPRVHPVDDGGRAVAHAEPDVPDEAVDALTSAGWEVSRWEETSHYFGGVTVVDRHGAAGDPRRDGAAVVL